MEKLNPNVLYNVEDRLNEDVLNDLPELFEKYDTVELVAPLDENNYWLLKDFKIPEWKTLRVNPTELDFDTLSNERELFLWTPWLRLCDDYWEEFKLKEYLKDDDTYWYYTGELWKTLTDSGDVDDIDA